MRVAAQAAERHMYHRKDHQEEFLVLQADALLIVEDQERRLNAWDFFHSPAGTDHIPVGAGRDRASSSR